MWRYLIARLLQGAAVVFLVATAAFLILRLTPGNPVDVLVGEAEVTPEQVAGIKHLWGLDRPWYVQYITWLENMARGDFGESVIRTGVPVRTMLAQAAPVTLTLNVAAFVVSAAIAIPVGIVAGVRRYSLFDYTGTVGATLGVALPSFWISLMAIILFAVKLRWLPAFGLQSWTGYVLPVAVLATEQTAVITRLMRGSVAAVLHQDYVRTGRAKGLAESAVVLRHAVRNALLPVITVLGYRVAFLLSGTIIVETVFALPGVGRLLTDSVYHLDYQVVQVIALLLAVIVVATNIATDLVYALVDPRIRIG
ncbi:MAG TPA: ABC transporter permease [bacterium]|jgi:peptide/nickel transport system permease protein|nr:ABC transporter permease [bacterium]